METMQEAVAGNIIWLLIAGCIVIGMILKAVIVIISTSAREKSRREIAAYIAEGSITAEQGERLLRADVSNRPAQRSG